MQDFSTMSPKLYQLGKKLRDIGFEYHCDRYIRTCHRNFVCSSYVNKDTSKGNKRTNPLITFNFLKIKGY